VKHVFVSGQQVVSDGHLTLIDEASLRREASEIRQRQRQATDTRTVDDLEPFYRQMLDKANKTFYSNWS
jgi:hypothetical protein